MTIGTFFSARVWGWLLSAMCAAVIAGACSSDTPAAGALAEGCLVNTDCNNPLVCAFRKCHNACESTRDCPPGLRCVASDRPFHVCQLQAERACIYNTNCPKGQTCASDAQCRDQCQGDADCLLNQRCVSGSCAEQNELKDGGLPIVLNDSGPSTGQPCSYNSQCPIQLVCRNNICQVECLTSVDCLDGRQCVESRCQVPLCPDSDAGAGRSCGFSSDCPAPLVCRIGTCTCECVQSADCPSGYDCIANRCGIATIGPEGGVVVSPDRRLTVSVPPGALAVRLHLTVDIAEAWPSGALGPVFEVRPSGTTFASAVTFVYRYQTADIAPFMPADIRLAVASGSTWTPLATTIDPVMSTATAQTTHLSTFGLIGPPPNGGLPDASSGGGASGADSSMGAGGGAGIGKFEAGTQGR